MIFIFKLKKMKCMYFSSHILVTLAQTVLLVVGILNVRTILIPVVGWSHSNLVAQTAGRHDRNHLKMYLCQIDFSSFHDKILSKLNSKILPPLSIKLPVWDILGVFHSARVSVLYIHLRLLV